SFANAMASTAITISDAGSGTHTLTPYDEPRYTANGDFNTAQARSEMQNGLLGAMAGRLTEISGLWRIYAGGYEAPTVTLSEKELAGAVHIEPVPATADAANGVRGVFMDTANLFTPTDFPAVSDDTYVAADGGEEIWASLDFTGFVTSSAQAQRLAKIELRRRRYALTFTAPFQLSAYRAMTARTVAMDFARYGWSAGTQEFEVGSSRFTLMKSGEGGDAPALGVELTLRQSAAAIWDWTLSEQQVQAAVRNTSLPSPFDVTDPGVPTVTESLYQTSGSAGVKTRALLAWSAADSLPVARYNLRYKAVDDADYTYPPSVPAGTAGAATAQIDDLGAGLYLFGIQAENLNGVQSQWVSVSKELVGLTAPPSDLTNFSITPTPGAQTAACSWDKLTANSDLDVLIGGAIEVRFSPLTSGATWNDGTVAAHVPGDSTSADVPHLSGTYMARAFDSSGNQSENAVSVITTAPDVINYNAVASLTEDATFTGAKSSTVVVGSVLTLDGGLAIDSITDLIDTWTAIDTESGVAASGTYDFSTYIDLGATYTSRVTATLKTQSVDVNDSVDARIDPIDSWGAIDGPEISDVDATLYIATTDDDPAGTPTWSSWRPFVIGDYKARAFKYRTVLTSSNQNHNIQVINLGAAVDMPDRTQGARDVTSGAGTYSVAYATPFKALPRIGITGKDMGTGDYFTVSSETVNGFDVVFRNSAAAAVSRKFDWEAKGY
ncbi:MAG TPA: hypothetical protein VN667_20050, partial [Burkholderiales bacterium]|nr:hypothetical protein [Burkholderiales bacterium]